MNQVTLWPVLADHRRTAGCRRATADQCLERNGLLMDDSYRSLSLVRSMDCDARSNYHNGPAAD
jgi:hypothetical protein